MGEDFSAQSNKLDCAPRLPKKGNLIPIDVFFWKAKHIDEVLAWLHSQTEQIECDYYRPTSTYPHVIWIPKEVAMLLKLKFAGIKLEI